MSATTPEKALVLRADGSAEIGMGHVARCAALAPALAAAGLAPVFATVDPTGIAGRFLEGRGLPLVALAATDE